MFLSSRAFCYVVYMVYIVFRYYQDKQGSVGLVMYGLTVESVTSWLHISSMKQSNLLYSLLYAHWYQAHSSVDEL